MKVKMLMVLAGILMTCLTACEKDKSLESGGSNSDPSLIGNDCRISRIAYADSATLIPLGSVAASINAIDNATDITEFDSLSMVIDFNASPVYSGDTVFINSKEYFLRNSVTGLIRSLHGLSDPTDLSSPTFNVTYSYNANNNLINKSYSYTLTPGIVFKDVTYTYSGGNLTHMTATDMTTGDTIADASISYYGNISPKNYMYFFPDEKQYAAFGQFFNFGAKPVKAVKDIVLQYYNAGLPTQFFSTTFLNYQASPEGYIVQVSMSGDDQPSLPVLHGRLKFSYHCM